jgi:AAA family ATP:ADP antiporter
MAENGIQSVFSRFIRIKPNELKISFLLFFYLFLVIAAYNVVKPIRNASFLEELGYQRLPLVYLLTAGLIGFVVTIHAKIQVKISRYSLIMCSILFFFITCVVFRFFSASGWKGFPVIFWVWANIFIIVLNTQFWIAVNGILNPREFKRQSGFFISGGILGGFIGGGLAGYLARENVDYNLLFLSAGLLSGAALFVHLIFRSQKGERPVERIRKKMRSEDKAGTASRPGFRDCYNTVKKHSYLRFIATIVALTLVVSTLIDFQWNIVVKESREGDLTSFFGYFNAGLMVFAFLLSILMTSNLFERYGIRLPLLIYPVVLLLCFLGIGVAATLVMAIIIKGSDKSLSYSINRSARELLFIPVSPEQKYKAIVFIDMFVDRFSKGLGAVVLMIILSFGIQDYREIIRVVSLVSVVLILAWIVSTLSASREYINSIKQKLSPFRKRADRVFEDELDVSYAKLIFDTLESKGRSSDLYAMHLFDLMKQGKLTPELRKLLAAGPEEPEAVSFGTFFEADRSALIRPSSDISNDHSLIKEIQDIMSLDIYETVIKGYLEKALSGKGPKAEMERMIVAKGIGFLAPDSPLVAVLDELLLDDSAEVRKYAIESASKLGKRGHVPALIQSLNDFPNQRDASAALESYGMKITGILADYLFDSEENIGLRRAVASILANIGNQEAADFILWELDTDKREMDKELIDALDRMRAEKQTIKYSDRILKKKLREEIMGYYRDYISFAEAESKGTETELCRTLSLGMSKSMMNIFKLLGLIYPREDIVKAYQDIQTGTKDSIAYAVELLDNTLEKEIRNAVLPILEELSQEDRVKACKALQKDFPEFE